VTISEIISEIRVLKFGDVRLGRKPRGRSRTFFATKQEIFWAVRATLERGGPGREAPTFLRGEDNEPRYLGCYEWEKTSCRRFLRGWEKGRF